LNSASGFVRSQFEKPTVISRLPGHPRIDRPQIQHMIVENRKKNRLGEIGKSVCTNSTPLAGGWLNCKRIEARAKGLLGRARGQPPSIPQE